MFYFTFVTSQTLHESTSTLIADVSSTVFLPPAGINSLLCAEEGEIFRNKKNF